MLESDKIYRHSNRAEEEPCFGEQDSGTVYDDRCMTLVVFVELEALLSLIYVGRGSACEMVSNQRIVLGFVSL